MGMNRLAGCSAAFAALVGCAAPSQNMRIGSEQDYASMEAQRAAVRAVAEADAVPAGAVVIGRVDASRCHRFQGNIEPTDEQLRDDLKTAAYARGADGIAGVEIVRESGITRNCWFIITGRATMYRAASARR